MVHRALDRCLRSYAEVSPELAARAAGALDRLLAGVGSSPWTEVAWRFSHLTGDGYPIELGFTAHGEAIRYVVEVAGPESNPAQRLDLALDALDDLHAVSGLPSCPVGTLGDMQDSLRTAQRATPESLHFGAWVGGRHGPRGDEYKLHAEVPKTGWREGEEWYRPLVGGRRLLPGRVASLRMVGLEPLTGRVELYFRADGLQRWELERLMGLLGLHHRVEELLALVEDVVERPVTERLPARQTGFSFSWGPDGTALAYSLFWLARHLLGDDARIRRRLLDIALRREWPLRHYAAISEPLKAYHGPQTRHGILSFVAAHDLAPMLHIGLRPPE